MEHNPFIFNERFICAVKSKLNYKSCVSQTTKPVKQ